MHQAPAVSFSADRSRWQLRCILALFFNAVVVLGIFELGQPQSGLQIAALAWTLLASVLIALLGWNQSPRGTLRWTGGHWHWSGYAEQPVCTVDLRMDFQSSLLLSLQRQGKRSDWLWLDAASDPASWRAFRRAVISGQCGFPDEEDVQTMHSHGEVA